MVPGKGLFSLLAAPSECNGSSGEYLGGVRGGLEDRKPWRSDGMMCYGGAEGGREASNPVVFHHVNTTDEYY